MASLIIAAKSFQIAMIVLMTTMMGIFVWFYEVGLDWALPLVVFFFALIILALTLYSTDLTSLTGGYGGK